MIQSSFKCFELLARVLGIFVFIVTPYWQKFSGFSPEQNAIPFVCAMYSESTYSELRDMHSQRCSRGSSSAAHNAYGILPICINL